MTDPSPQSTPKVRLWPVLKWCLLIVILAFIGRRAWQLWLSVPREPVRVEWVWLLLASSAYLIGWLPSVWFWRALLVSMRQPLGSWDAARAYYVGHLGKYVPGKALVLVIRAALVKDQGVNPLLAGVCAVYETLVFMATGAVLALAFGPFALRGAANLPAAAGLEQYRMLWPLLVIMAFFATTPLSAWLFTKLCHKMVRGQFSDSPSLPAISAWLICQGIAVTAIGWACHALSLGFVLRSLSKLNFSLSSFLVWLASTALATVAGFVVLIAPGGVGVREGVLIETLNDQPDIGPQTALLAAGLLRVVWFVTELLAAAFFTVAHKWLGTAATTSGGQPTS